MKSLLILLLFVSSYALADCSALTGTTLTTGKAGEIKLSVAALTTVGKIMYCDGTNWQDLGGSPTLTACSKSGEIDLSGGELRYCNSGFYWAFDSGSVTNGLCTKAGEIRWNTNQLEFCNGTNWRVVSADTTEDPFTGETLTGTNIGEIIDRDYLASGFTADKTLNVVFNNPGNCSIMRVKVCGNSSCTNTSAHISERITNGTLTVPNGSYIYVVIVTSQNVFESCSVDFSLGSQNWTLATTTGNTDTTPSFAQMPYLRNQTPSTLVSSTIRQATSFTSANMSISDNSTGGTPEFRICSDSACGTVIHDWGTTLQTISNQQWFQLRTNLGSGTQNLRQVTYSIGGQTSQWFAMTSTCPATTTLASGATLTCTCPANYANVTLGTTATGTSTYSQTSDVCRAALHAGAYSNLTGGSITARGNTAATCPSFTGTNANGVSTTSSATAAKGMFFVGFGTDACN